jgi:hypothetical protein
VTRFRAAAAPLARVVALAVVAGCHSHGPDQQVGTRPCAAPAAGDSLESSATAVGLPGEYRLHLAATTGPNSGRSIDGDLRLWPVPDSLAHEVMVLGVRDSMANQPVGGSAELDRAALGIVRTGDLGGSDPTAPGVLVIEHRARGPGARPQIVLRMGADANRRGRVRYDGGYFALTLRGMGADGFSGTWASGAGPTAASATGYFCAGRVVQES